VQHVLPVSSAANSHSLTPLEVLVSQVSSIASTISATTTTFTMPTPSALPAGYIELDPAECGQARFTHLTGIFGILGTGICYLVKRNAAGTFLKDQMKEAFNFHVLVFAIAVVLSVTGMFAGKILGLLALVFSLASLALWVGAVVLSVLNSMKAGKGQVARYPARISVLK
jgi:uncharacterized Tic20 family protein